MSALAEPIVAESSTAVLGNGVAPVIVADGIWKSYPRQTYRLSLKHDARRLVRQIRGQSVQQDGRSFWALRDISFSVRPGESLAVIGRNGSGKSTLFKVLCGITSPARGSSEVHGRFAAMISLGAGFIKERTGRENIYLTAAIHGWEPRQIEPIIDDIMAFSEIPDFMDIPVKRYSSGMSARLGFSIAVHIAPEILFIDEALSVGDAGFRKKCLDRIFAMKADGRTILLVSHSAEMVRLLCERAIWLHQGRMRLDGPTPEVLDRYNAFLKESEDPRDKGSKHEERIERAMSSDVGF
jgi:lipopolysaccharide transport system ATP-binding protein